MDGTPGPKDGVGPKPERMHEALHWTAVLDDVDEPHLVFDPRADRIVYMNRSAEALLGPTRTGKSLVECMTDPRGEATTRLEALVARAMDERRCTWQLSLHTSTGARTVKAIAHGIVFDWSTWVCLRFDARFG